MPVVCDVQHRGCGWRLWHECERRTVTVLARAALIDHPSGYATVILSYQFRPDEDFFDDLEDEDGLAQFAADHAEDVFTYKFVDTHSRPMYRDFLPIDDIPWEIHAISDSEARLAALRAYRHAMGIDHE